MYSFLAKLFSAWLVSKRNSHIYIMYMRKCKSQTPSPMLVHIFIFSCLLIHTRVLEPVGSTVFLLKPRFSIGEATRDTTLTLWRIWAVEEGNMLVPNVSEPVFIRQLESQSQRPQLTSGSCLNPQRVPEQYCELARHPISRRRSLQLYPGG
jgi:hypothetical protein